LAEAFNAKGDHDKAIQFWKKLLDQHPDDQGIQSSLAEAFRRKRSQDKARIDSNQSLKY